MALLCGEGHFVGMVWVRIQLRWHFSVFKSERVVTKPDLSLTGILFLTSKRQIQVPHEGLPPGKQHISVLCSIVLNYKPRHLKGTYVIISYELHLQTFLS